VNQPELSLPLGHAAAMEEAPFGIPSRKLVMWLFIIADAATFGAILFGYGYLRAGSPNWSRPFAFAPTILNGMVMTAILLTSSLTMLMAVAAAQADRRPVAVRWIGLTAVLGVAFAGLHLREWTKMIAEVEPLGQSAGGLRIVRRELLQHHRPPPAPRDGRSHRPRGDGHRIRPWPLDRGSRGNHRTVLALRRSGLDVRLSAGLPDERPVRPRDRQ
jgi:multisubunit Na+/H+ antiporter MnhC subunit